MKTPHVLAGATTAVVAALSLLVPAGFAFANPSSSISITGATLNGTSMTGSNSITVGSGATISAAVTVDLTGSDSWHGTGYRFGSSGSYICVDTTNYDSAGTYTNTFNITAPNASGAYDISFKAYPTSDCGSSGDTDTFSQHNGVIVLANSTTAITSDTPDPSVVGQQYAVGVSVTRSSGTNHPSGSVVISDGDGATCSASLSYQGSGVSTGSCDLTSTSTSVTTLTATYSGDSNFNGSSGTGSHTVNQGNTTISITNDLSSPSTVGNPYEVDWTVAATTPATGTPTGTVIVSDGTVICSADVTTGKCDLTSTTPGSKTITATYGGDTNFLTSSITASHTVWAGLTLTPTPPTSVNVGTSVNLTVFTGDFASPTYSVSSSSDPFITSGDINSTSGAFTWTPSSSETGTQTITFSATDGADTESTSTTITVTSPLSFLTASPASATAGGPITLSAQFFLPISGQLVSFSLNGIPVGTATTNGSGLATLATTTPASITAGDYPTGVTASTNVIGIGTVTSSADLTITGAAVGPVEDVTQGTYFSTIQAAVDAASSSDLIVASAGTYPEQVHITKSLTIDGANAGINPNTGTRGAESIIDASGGLGTANGFYIDSSVSNVTIDGFEFEGVKGESPAGESGVIAIGGAGTTVTDLTVENNIFDNIGRGLDKDANASFNGLYVTDNLFENVGTEFTADDTYSAVKIQAQDCTASGCENLDITGNTVATTTYAAFLWADVDGVNVSDNTISNTATYAIGVGGGNPAGGDTTIENNTIDGAGTATNGAIRIKGDAGTLTGDVLVEGNTITNSDIGVSVDDGISATGTFMITKNDFDDVAETGVLNGTGNALLDALDNWWGSATGPTDTVSGDGSVPDTNPGGTGSAALGAVEYGTWCTDSDCSTDNSAPPAAPVITGFTQNGKILACGAATNSNASVTINWSESDSGINQYAITPIYPDGKGEYTYYPSGSATSDWIGDNFANPAQYHGEGVYSYTIEAQGTNGLWSSASSACTLTYDITRPTLVFNEPAANSTASTTLPVSVTASDAGSGLSDLIVHLYSAAGTYLGACGSGDNSLNGATSDTYTCTLDTSSLPEGDYSLRAGTFDEAGNNQTVSQPFIVDHTGPTVTVTPVAGSTLSGTETFTITVTDANPLDPTKNTNVWVYLYNNLPPQTGQGASVNLSSGTGTFTVDTTKLANGAATLDVGIVYDAAGNASGVGDNYFSNYTIDNTVAPAPELTITAPAADGDYATSTYDFTAEYDNGVTTNLDWAIRLDNDSCNSNGTNTVAGDVDGFNDASTLSGTTFSTTLDTTGWQGGNYCFVVNDNNGLRETRLFTVDNTAPDAPTLVSPANGATVDGASVTQSWSDSDPTIDHYIYESYNDAGATSLRYSQQFASTTLSKIATNVADATYWWRVEAVDAAGNVSVSPLWELTVDNSGGGTGGGETTTSVDDVVHEADLATDATDVASNPSDWFFYNDETDQIDDNLGAFVDGPMTAPLGNGSAQISTSDASDGIALGTLGFEGTPLSDITSLSYSTYRSAGDPAVALALEFDVNTDGTTSPASYEGRLVFEPYLTGATVETDAWQNWNAATAAGWWFSHANTGDTGSVTTSCTEATPCTLAQVLAEYPQIGISGGTYFKAGSGWVDPFTGNVDDFVMTADDGTNATTTTTDFEPRVSTVTTITNATDLSNNSSVVNEPFTVDWSVVPQTGIGTPTGVVTVTANGGTGCSDDVSAGSCTITPASTGTITLVATYSGDSSFDQSDTDSSVITHQVVSAPDNNVVNDVVLGGGGGNGPISDSYSPYDLNHDGKVNLLDLNILFENWGRTGANIPGDFNHDGVVNLLDLNLFLANWLG